MAADTVPALVLDDTVTGAASEPVHFANFGGLWLEGQAVAVSELGFESDAAAYAAVEEAGLPLVKTKVKSGEGAMPAVENHYAAGEEPEPLEPLVPAAELVEENADDLIAHVANVGDTDTLDDLAAAEKDGKNRTTVLAAIEARREALTVDPVAGG